MLYTSPIQMLCGCPYVDPGEVVVDFVLRHYDHFKGVFWLNGTYVELMYGAQLVSALHTFTDPCILLHV